MSNKNGSKWCRPSTRLAIYLRDDFTCVYCGKNLKNVKAKLRTLDHIVPREDGGSNAATSLVTACKRCNDLKGSRSLRDFVITFRSKDKTCMHRVFQQRYTLLPRALARELLKGEIT